MRKKVLLTLIILFFVSGCARLRNPQFRQSLGQALGQLGNDIEQTENYNYERRVRASEAYGVKSTGAQNTGFIDSNGNIYSY